ncbi:MAG TPA: glutathione S-transferase family protein [Gammaproteobacteria bacterium]|nr:glutathione S-transferase family protein [Gammaproteobacteria bacterium]
MGYLENGQWHTGWYDTSRTGGRFVRPETQFRDRVTADGSSGFPAAAGRYHLYVSLACPWAHRTLIMRGIKGLENVISVSVVHPHMGEDGWAFGDAPGCMPDTVNGARLLREVYVKARPDYTGRVTVPVLWDRETGTIVNNESAEILRMLEREFDAFGRADLDFHPPGLREEIDRINPYVYERINNGVYRAGFATTQQAYEEAAGALFEALDSLEERLRGQSWLCGERITEADWRLFTTLVRFDAVYHGHFKCNRSRLVDYPELWDYTRALYQFPGVAPTVSLDHIKQHYYTSHPQINPTGIVPIGPAIDFERPTRRQGM